jgi:hypothetical protein
MNSAASLTLPYQVSFENKLFASVDASIIANPKPDKPEPKKAAYPPP